jgi:hypothetical protein
MAGTIKMTVGFAVGYVLGARAGREQYEQIAEAARRLAQRPEVQQATARVRERLGVGGGRATTVAPVQEDQVRAEGSGLLDDDAVEPVSPRHLADPLGDQAPEGP